MKPVSLCLASLAVLILSASADAYVGPGAGLSLLGALWALIVAIGAALAFILAWPVRKYLRRRRAERAAHLKGHVAPDVADSAHDSAQKDRLD